ADRMNTVGKAVASRTLEVANWANTELLRGEASETVRGLKQRSGKDIFVFGSAELLDTLWCEGLVDECRVCLAPVVLGQGSPLFRSPPTTALRLLESRALRTGGVILRYEVAKT